MPLTNLDPGPSTVEAVPVADVDLADMDLADVDSQQHADPHRVFCTYLDLGWKKLNKYYALTDDSPVYLAAVVLHPAFTWSWVHRAWKYRPDWITNGEKSVKELWAEYADTLIVTAAAKERRERSSIWELSDDEDDTSQPDEYTRWCSRPQEPDATHPLEHWSTDFMRRSYPRLSQMAIDILTIPAMSDEPERTFSMTGILISPLRNRIVPATVSKTICLKSWDSQKVVNLATAFVSNAPEMTAVD